jgi:hypothetical protein
VACPFFMPIQKLETGAWPHTARLPLGCGWSGHCTAPGHEGEVPTQGALEEFCNLGYARKCSCLPQQRVWDAVRFAVAAQQDQRGRGDGSEIRTAQSRVIQLRYVCEREHRPVEHGRLKFDIGAAGWLDRHPDIRVQKMAECFLESWLNKRTPQVATALEN